MVGCITLLGSRLLNSQFFNRASAQAVLSTSVNIMKVSVQGVRLLLSIPPLPREGVRTFRLIADFGCSAAEASPHLVSCRNVLTVVLAPV